MSRPPRIEGFGYLGPYRYFVTFCTFDRRAVFNDVALGHRVISQFRRTCAKTKFAILAYCLMPDHAHLPRRRKIGALRLSRINQKPETELGPAARLSNEAAWDRVLRPDDDAKKVARYIVENPVRAGLVRRAADYPHVGSDVWTLEELIDSLW